MNSFIICLILFILGVISLALYVLFAFERSNAVTFLEMRKCEQVIRRNFYKYQSEYRIISKDGSVDHLDINGLANELGLEIMEAKLPKQVRGILDATTQPQYHGVIKHTKETSLYSSNFDIIHEMVHYIKDVGVGKRVDKSFARAHHGNPKSHQEQVIDYYAAAMAIPQESLKKRISAYGCDPYDDQFVAQMMDVYKQPRETVIRRISEVLSLS